MSNLAAFSSKTLLSFNCEPSQRPYIRKVKIESMQESNAVFFEFDCVDEFSNNMLTVQGASFYAFLGTVEVLFYTLMLMSLLNCCFHAKHDPINEKKNEHNKPRKSILDEYKHQNYSCVYVEKD